MTLLHTVLGSLSRRSRSRGPIGRRARRRLVLEPLEGRALLATFTVANGADAGAGSLRAAIAAANDEVANPGPDTINFGAGVTAVTLTSAQLTLSSDVTVTGPAGGVTIARDAAASEFRIFEVRKQRDSSAGEHDHHRRQIGHYWRRDRERRHADTHELHPQRQLGQS